MRTLWLLITLSLFFISAISKGQEIILKPKTFLKVDARIDEEVDLDELRKQFNDRDLWRERDLYKGKVNIEDSLTLFFLRRPEGFYQILTREKIRKNKKASKEKVYFEDIWNGEISSSLTRLNQFLKKLPCSTIETFSSVSSDDQIIYDDVRLEEISPSFLMKDCDLYFSLEKTKDRTTVYFPLSIILFKNKEDGEIKELGTKDSILFNAISPYYSFISTPIFSSEETSRINKKGQNELYSQLLHSIYFYMTFKLDMIGHSGESYMKDISIPLLNNRAIRNWQNDALITFVSNSDAEKGTMRQFAEYLKEDYNIKFLQENGCNIGYTIQPLDSNPNLKGILVIPEKFFLPYRLKIISVDEIPWEKYQQKLCKKF